MLKNSKSCEVFKPSGKDFGLLNIYVCPRKKKY